MLFHLRTKKFHYHIHIVHFITRDFAHHELTQNSIDSRIFYCIAISKSLNPCHHLIYRMDILETYGTSDLSRVPFRISSLNGSVTSLILLIGGVTSGITIRVSDLVKQCFQKYIFVSADERLVHLPYRIIS